MMMFVAAKAKETVDRCGVIVHPDLRIFKGGKEKDRESFKSRKNSEILTIFVVIQKMSSVVTCYSQRSLRTRSVFGKYFLFVRSVASPEQFFVVVDNCVGLSFFPFLIGVFK